MKVGDLVQVLPAKAGYYIIIEKLPRSYRPNTKTYWQLFPATSGIYSYGPMKEEFIEVTSESR